MLLMLVFIDIGSMSMLLLNVLAVTQFQLLCISFPVLFRSIARSLQY